MLPETRKMAKDFLSGRVVSGKNCVSLHKSLTLGNLQACLHCARSLDFLHKVFHDFLQLEQTKHAFNRRYTFYNMKEISTKKAPAAIGPYSQAIDLGSLVITSGQLPIDPATGAFPEGGIKEQTLQSLTNVKEILAEAGLSMNNVVKTTVFLADMADFAAMNEVYSSFFESPYPARSAVAVKTLPKGALVEVECIAAR